MTHKSNPSSNPAMSRNPYPTVPAVDKGELPDPFALADGGRVATAEQWKERAGQWVGQIVEMEYGGLPPDPEAVEIETLCHSRIKRWPGVPLHFSYRLHCRGGERPFSFCVRVVAPQGPGPFPLVIHGDGCWWYQTDEAIQRLLELGCAYMTFNRTEMAEDEATGLRTAAYLPTGLAPSPHQDMRSWGLYAVYPAGSFGALSAWAWGYHRCVDLACRLPWIDATRIAVTGHSRGGKATLLAGATDPRISLINDNASCAGGGALFRYVGDGGETLNIVKAIPSWFGKGLHPYVGREEAIPFDQHCLLASLAPRPVLLTYALDDRWSNPEGMVQCASAAREVYAFLGAEEELAFHLRPGEHSHHPEDWATLFDFIAWKWMDATPEKSYNRHPYTHLKATHSWRRP